MNKKNDLKYHLEKKKMAVPENLSTSDAAYPSLLFLSHLSYTYSGVVLDCQC